MSERTTDELERVRAELEKWQEHDETLCDLLGEILYDFRRSHKEHDLISAQYWIDRIE